MVIFIGLAVTALGIYLVTRSYRLSTDGLLAVGTITKLVYRGRGGPRVHVQFKTVKNKVVEFDGGGGSFVPVTTYYQVGNQVMVLYDPNNPGDAIIYSWEFLYLVPYGVIAGGLYMIYKGFTY
jgi:hypothetical protein